MGMTLTQPVDEESKILLVDDDEAVLKGTKRVLEKAGHRVIGCSSGDDALELLASQTFEAMVSDIQMPGVTGLKLLRAVREFDLDLPVVLMTGAPGINSAAEAVEYGAFRYLIKPVPLEELTSVVGRAVNLCRMPRAKRDYIEQFGSGRFRVGDLAGVDAMVDRALASLWMAY